MGPDSPRNVTIDTSALTNNSKMKWNGVKGAVGYEVVWRPTDQPFWTHVIAVRNVTTAEVVLSKDNVEFGVRSVTLHNCCFIISMRCVFKCSACCKWSSNARGNGSSCISSIVYHPTTAHARKGPVSTATAG